MIYSETSALNIWKFYPRDGYCKTKRAIWIILMSFFFILPKLAAQDTTARLHLKLLPIDLLYMKAAASSNANHEKPNLDGKATIGNYFKGSVRNMSMQQSVALTTNINQVAAYGGDKLAKWLWKPKQGVGRKIGYHATGQLLWASSFLLSFSSLYGDTWLHENGHRAVMNLRGVASTYDSKIISFIDGNTKNVSGVYDAALAKFKLDHPQEFARMLVAGGEIQLAAKYNMQYDNFFNNAQLPTELYCIAGNFFIQNYFSADNQNVNSTNTYGNENSELQRDFTGHDYSGWIYHLSRPQENYYALGVAPNGKGVDRYINTTRLNADELNYYDKVRGQAWLNWLSPMYFGFRRIRIKEDFYANFLTQYQPTSFGVDKNVTFFLDINKNKYLAGLHIYQNRSKNFYAIDAGIVDKKIIPKKLTADIFVTIGTQPKNQEFRTDKSALLAYTKLNAYYKISKHWDAMATLSIKGKGWITTEENLNSSVRPRFGVRYNIYK